MKVEKKVNGIQKGAQNGFKKATKLNQYGKLQLLKILGHLTRNAKQHKNEKDIKTWNKKNTLLYKKLEKFQLNV